MSWFSITWLSIESIRFTVGVTSFTSTVVLVDPAFSTGSTVSFCATSTVRFALYRSIFGALASSW